MSENPDLTEAIVTNAAGPRRVTIDGQSVEQHSIADQILAEEHRARKKLSKKAWFGIRPFRVKPPGGTGEGARG